VNCPADSTASTGPVMAKNPRADNSLRLLQFLATLVSEVWR
jgi:hypothetical protein